MDYRIVSLGGRLRHLRCFKAPEPGFEGHGISVTELRSVCRRRRVLLFRYYAELGGLLVAVCALFFCLRPFSAGDETPRCAGTVALLFWSRCLVSFSSSFSFSLSAWITGEEKHKPHDIVIKLGRAAQPNPIVIKKRGGKKRRTCDKQAPQSRTAETSDSSMSTLFSIWLNQMSAAKLGDLSNVALALRPPAARESRA